MHKSRGVHRAVADDLQVCRRGHEECAHWACVKHGCKVEICSLHGTYKP